MLALSTLCASLARNVVRVFFFFFNDTATTEIYTLSLHDALPILDRHGAWPRASGAQAGLVRSSPLRLRRKRDRKSTRLNSSHVRISYAVFCLKKKKQNPVLVWTAQPRVVNRCCRVVVVIILLTIR